MPEEWSANFQFVFPAFVPDFEPPSGRTSRIGAIMPVPVLVSRTAPGGSTADSVQSSSPSSRAVALCRKRVLHVALVV